MSGNLGSLQGGPIKTQIVGLIRLTVIGDRHMVPSAFANCIRPLGWNDRCQTLRRGAFIDVYEFHKHRTVAIQGSNRREAKLKDAIGVFIGVAVNDLHEKILSLTPAVGAKSRCRIEIDASQRLISESIRTAPLSNRHIVRGAILERQRREIAILASASGASRGIASVSAKRGPKAFHAAIGLISKRRAIFEGSQIRPIGNSVSDWRGGFVHVPEMQRILVGRIWAQDFGPGETR